MIFVYGANEAGIHGAGAAKFALQQHGAQWRKIGHVGNSYGIPTKDKRIKTLPLDDIKAYVDEFIQYATDHPELQFQVTAIGTGLAGYQHSDIAPMFAHAPNNCHLPDEWVAIISTER